MTDSPRARTQSSPQARLDSGDSTGDVAPEDDGSPTRPGREDDDPSARSGNEDDSSEEISESEADSLPETAESADRGTDSDRRLLLDAMLGKLARYLRMCGYDAAYALDRGVEADAQLLQLARQEARVLVTRNRRLAERADRSILVESKQILDQLRELRETSLTIELSDQGAHCGSCNGNLETLPETVDRPDHAPAEGPVWRCVDCDQLFWKGSHWESVRERLADL
ncbi:MAG: hypothetical protein A07HR60_01665 [uncultured archaeon A07HR60]|nr:MAG: hypothetical protein A07HR60_01665 [uncultured archaeon A07HR60]